MTKSMLAAIAEAAGLNEPEIPQSHAPAFRAAPIQPPPTPAPELSLPEQIVQTWKTDPAIRAEFRSLSIYAAWRTRDAAKTAGIPVAQIHAQHPDVSGYLAKRGKDLGPGESAAIDGYAATWRTSSDIRAEFRTFEVFAAYIRAKARGQAQIIGHE